MKFMALGWRTLKLLTRLTQPIPLPQTTWAGSLWISPNKHAGEAVHILVNRRGYVVVNWEFQDQTLPASNKVDDVGVTLVVCQQKDLAEYRLRYYQLTADFLSSAASKSKEQVVKGGEPQEIDFERYIKEWATQYGLSAEQAKAEVEKWVAEVQQKRDSTSDLALAEFYQKHFSKAELLFQQSAQDQITDLEKLRQKEKEAEAKLTAKIVNNLSRAGDASYNDYRFADALAHYEKAHKYATRDSDPQLWAATLVNVGEAHEELGIRVEGKAGNEHLAAAIT